MNENTSNINSEQTDEARSYPSFDDSVKINLNNSPNEHYLNEEYLADFSVKKLKYCGDDRYPEFAEIIFKCKRREIYHNPFKLKVTLGELVIIETDNGLDIGTVASCGEDAIKKVKLLPNSKLPKKKIVRHANSHDFEKHIRNAEDELEVEETTRGLVEKYKLEMKVTDAVWQFDRQRLTISFTAPQRIDFRELVKDLARTFKTRIELRQISTREEAKRIGGVGSCGLNLCCTSFACDFCHVTLDHARTQQLSNNVAKLSGFCGRLKCCLLYEYDVYTEAFKNFPPMNSRLKFKEGMGHIIKADIFKDVIFVHIPKTGVYKTLTRPEMDEMMSKKLVLPPPEEKHSKPTNKHKHKFHEGDDDIEELKKLEG
jgi:cell fate regulator YaaT (PSP1 superfamily)